MITPILFRCSLTQSHLCVGANVVDRGDAARVAAKALHLFTGDYIDHDHFPVGIAHNHLPQTAVKGHGGDVGVAHGDEVVLKLSRGGAPDLDGVVHRPDKREEEWVVQDGDGDFFVADLMRV